MTPYRHTQVGTLVLVLLGIVIIFLVALIAVTAPHPIALAAGLIMLICIALFPSLTVEVSVTKVRIRFGLGPIGKTFPVSAIEQARAVRNPWYYGWGIRWFPHGWLFNVSGFDAVELIMRDRRVYRIGTDQPDELLAAIQSVLAAEPATSSKGSG